MATQYTSILKLALPTEGELSGTWGDVVNDNITSMVEEAIAGRAVINTWVANSHTLTTANGLTSEARCAMLEFTDSGTALTGAGTVICPTASKIYVVKNASGQAVTLTTAAGTGIQVPNSETMFLFCDGTNVIEAVTSVKTLKIADGTQVNTILDEDNMASDSATALATQQSIKAYVDAQIGVNNELSEVLSNGNTSGGTSIQLTTTDEVQFRDTALKIYSSADGQLDIDADTELEITAPIVDIDASTEVNISNAAKVGGTLSVDTVGELTPDAGVTVDSVLLKDDSVNATTVETTNLKANDGTAAVTVADTTGVVTVSTSVKVDTINEVTAAGGVTIDGVLLKDNGVTGTGNLDFNGGTIKLDGNYPTGTENVALGDTALDSVTTGGDYNTAIGSSALTANTTGVRNTAVGRTSLESNVSGSYNTGVGMLTLTANTASSNTAVGYQALTTNISGAENTSVGEGAGFCNTTGNANTSVGYRAYARGSTVAATGSCNTAVGKFSLYSNGTGNINTASGYAALQENTTGCYNTAFGGFALYANTSGHGNTAFGYAALDANVGAVNCNTAVGYAALSTNTTGNDNVGVGAFALYDNIGGVQNSAVGNCALCSNTSGQQNTAVGHLSGINNATGCFLTAIGRSAASANVSGCYNTALGGCAMSANTTGKQNTAVGFSAMKSWNATLSGTSRNVAVGDYSGFEMSDDNAVCNTLIGSVAGYYITTGACNTAVGARAMLGSSASKVTNIQNVAVGNDALVALCNGAGNVAVGFDALGDNTSGSNNIGIGLCALPRNVSASANIGIGACAGFSNNTGTSNVYIGFQAGFTNATSSNNTAVGFSALQNATSEKNAAFGNSALLNLTTGACNTALGSQAASCLTTGSFNVYIGRDAGPTTSASPATGDSNISIGTFALKNITSGERNVMVGVNAGCCFTDDSDNTAVGFKALTKSSGTFNVAVGSCAGAANTIGCRATYIGTLAGSAVTIGVQNTFLGETSGCAVTTGSNNTIIGRYSGNMCGLDISTADSNIVVANGLGCPVFISSSSEACTLRNHIIYGRFEVDTPASGCRYLRGQALSGGALLTASDTYVDLFRSGHTWTGTVWVQIIDPDTFTQGTATAVYTVSVSYGNGVIVEQNDNSICGMTGVTFIYDNVGYKMKIKASFSATGNKCVYYYVNGISTCAMIDL